MKKKPLVGTWYAVRRKSDGWWQRDTDGEFHRSFVGAGLFTTRRDARDIAGGWGEPRYVIEVVPVRCRPLTSKRRNVKRTR